MRVDFVSVLINVAETNENIIVVDADCSRSTKTQLFKDRFPNRFFNVGISEQNAIGISAGMSRSGYITFVNSFAAMLVFRGAEQIIQSVCLPSIPVNIVGHYSGISASLEGAPHHALFDISFLNSLPNMEIFTPSTSDDISYAVQCAISSEKPTYTRLSRNPLEYVESNAVTDNGEYKLYKRSKGDVLLVTYGQSLSECLKASNDLEKKSIKCGVLSITKLKPLNSNEISSVIDGFARILTVEEHSSIGGIGTIITSILQEKHIQKKLGIIGIDSFTETGQYYDLLNKYNISAQKIVKYVLEKLT